MLWTQPRSTMDPLELPNLKVLYQKEYYSNIEKNNKNDIVSTHFHRLRENHGQKSAKEKTLPQRGLVFTILNRRKTGLACNLSKNVL